MEHKGAPIGLVPGYVKRTPVAWFATHHSTPQGDAFYEYSYLFQLSYDLPPGAKTLTLPDDPKIRVFAVSVSREPSTAPPAAPLYDTLADHQLSGAPIIPQTGQSFPRRDRDQPASAALPSTARPALHARRQRTHGGLPRL